MPPPPPAATTPEAAPQDTEVIKGLLYRLRDGLQSESKPEIETATKDLRSGSNAMTVMEMLSAPLLLGRDQQEAIDLNEHEALRIITFLASQDATTYLKAASRAVKTTTELLCTSTSITGTNQSLVVSDDLVLVLVAQLSGQDVQVSTNATTTLVHLSKRLGPSLTKTIMSRIVDAWKNASESIPSSRQIASTVCVRCAAATVELMCLQEECMDYATSTDVGATHLLLGMLNDSSDPLLQMSVLDILETMATTTPMHNSRAGWLLGTNCLEPLLQMAGGSGTDYPDPILGGPALRLLSRLCRLGSHGPTNDGQQQQQMLLQGFHRALSAMDGSGELDRLALLDAVSSFAASSNDALEMVLTDGAISNSWLSLSVAQPKLKAAILHSIAMVMTNTATASTEQPVPLSNTGCMHLLSSLGQVNNQEASSLLLSLARSTIVEVRLGAYAVLAAVSCRGTGAQVLLSSSDGFLEFLLSRTDEPTKEGKEGRFAIVQAVLHSPAKALLADRVVHSLEKHVREGPYYVPTQRWDVVTE